MVDDVLPQFLGLIKWALSHSIAKYGLSLDPCDSFEDLVQETVLRLLTTLRNRELPEHMPSYVVRSARRVVSDYVRSRSWQRNQYDESAPEMLGRVTRNRKLRIARGVSSADKKLQAAAAVAKRWEGHVSTGKTPAQLAQHRETEKRRRERKRIEAEGEISLPKHLERKTREAMTPEERKRRAKLYRVAKVAGRTPEEEAAAKAYQARKQAEYRERRRAERAGV